MRRPASFICLTRPLPPAPGRVFRPLPVKSQAPLVRHNAISMGLFPAQALRIPTALQAQTPLPALVLSASLAMLLESKTKVGRAISGSLCSFLFMACLANVGVVPATCAVYDACWSTVLPASLSLSVFLAAGIYWRDRQSQSSLAPGQSSARASSKSPFRAVWGRVALAYGLGAVGSLIGALLAFATVSHTRSLPSTMAAKCVSATAATYIGGTVNFFQVAKAVGLEAEGGAAVLGALAAADVFLMAVYFALLLAMRRSRGLAAWLSGERDDRLRGLDGRGTQKGQGAQGLVSTATSEPSLAPSTASSSPLPRARRLRTGLLSVASLLLPSLGMGLLGQWLEKVWGLIGASAGLITLLSLGFWTMLLRVLPAAMSQSLLSYAVPLSSLLFNLFFAGIGAGASPGPLIACGPAVLGLMAITLAVHLGTSLLALRGLNALSLSRGRPEERVGVDELVVASNANIGGPATAAALAGALGRPDLVLPATAMGTVGYALATTLGVVLYSFLRRV